MRNRERIVRILIIFSLIIILFFAIEIIPLYFGPAHMPWNELINIVQKRLPKIVLIAAAAAIFIGTGNRSD
ncbi:MAG: hypothetical protein GF350_13510 [Chitinivibrionales bacterium]|nr:hypothetical protein [Chitinivibrionales bacterium]